MVLLCLKAEGIFRINADNSQEEFVRDQLNRGLVPLGIDVHCLSGLIKVYTKFLILNLFFSIMLDLTYIRVNWNLLLFLLNSYYASINTGFVIVLSIFGKEAQPWIWSSAHFYYYFNLINVLQAWFRELPTGVLDSLTPEQVMHCNTEEDCTNLMKLLPSTEAALLDWAINLMADVVEREQFNKMNARNVAMVFAPNMTQVSQHYKQIKMYSSVVYCWFLYSLIRLII